jgi:hypothetical protein
MWSGRNAPSSRIAGPGAMCQSPPGPPEAIRTLAARRGVPGSGAGAESPLLSSTVASL